MDILNESAKAFKELLDKEYFMKIGRKGVATEFKIIFEAEDFRHLAGIQYLEDIPVHKRTAYDFFNGALSGTFTEKTLQDSIHFDYMKERLENLKNLESYLDNNMLVFKWDLRQAKYSSIGAEYMLREDKAEKKAYVFLKEKSSLFGKNKNLKVSEIKKENAISFFLSNGNYDKGQVQYTLLRNEKVNLVTGTREVLYDFEEVKRQRLAAPQKSPTTPALTEFEVTRELGKKFTVQLNDVVKTYELIDGADNIKIQTDKIVADFGISEEQARELFDNAYSQNALEAQVARESKSELAQSLPDLQKSIEVEKEEIAK